MKLEELFGGIKMSPTEAPHLIPGSTKMQLWTSGLMITKIN